MVLVAGGMAVALSAWGAVPPLFIHWKTPKPAAPAATRRSTIRGAWRGACMSNSLYGLIQFLACKSRGRTFAASLFGSSYHGLYTFEEIGGSEVSDHPLGGEFLAVLAEEHHAGRPVDAEAPVERLVVIVVGGHVRLQQHHLAERRLHR